MGTASPSTHSLSPTHHYSSSENLQTASSTRCTFPPPPTSSCDTLRPPISLPRLPIASPITHHEARRISLQRMDMHRHLRLRHSHPLRHRLHVRQGPSHHDGLGGRP